MGVISPEVMDEIMAAPFIAGRAEIIDGYARRYWEGFEGLEDLGDYVTQAALDIGDKSIIPELKARIRRLKRARVALRQSL
jgi:hypothetical protein